MTMKSGCVVGQFCSFLDGNIGDLLIPFHVTYAMLGLHMKRLDPLVFCMVHVSEPYNTVQQTSEV